MSRATKWRWSWIGGIQTCVCLPFARDVGVAITAAVTVTVAGGWLPCNWEGSMKETGGITEMDLVLVENGCPPAQEVPQQLQEHRGGGK